MIFIGCFLWGNPFVEIFLSLNLWEQEHFLYKNRKKKFENLCKALNRKTFLLSSSFREISNGRKVLMHVAFSPPHWCRFFDSQGLKLKSLIIKWIRRFFLGRCFFPTHYFYAWSQDKHSLWDFPIFHFQN